MSSAFQPGEYVVYPSHGVGCIVSLAEQAVAGSTVQFLVVEFSREAMMLQIPQTRVHKSGLRHLSSREGMEAALSVLSEPRCVACAPWMRQIRALEEKVRSGDPKTTAEVVRDLAVDSPNVTVRRLYRTALARLVQELALVEQIEESAAQTNIEARLHSSSASAMPLDLRRPPVRGASSPKTCPHPSRS